MQFFSTRDQNRKVTSSQAIAQGLSDEGGLFVPESFPQVDVKALCGLDYPALAAAVVREYLTDYDPAFLTEATRSTYGAAFGGKAGYLAPVEGDTYALELWHGPTCAFKDYALQLMPKLLVEAKKNLGRTEKTLILVATSGDTGKAALDGYHDIPGVEIAVFYPTGGTSEIQRLQMATQEGANVAVYAVRGNFDDAQTGVKKVFGDKAIAAELEKRNIRLSSANSINWGRLVPQIVYYFAAYAQLLRAGKITFGDEVDFCVPTGNFGDILAGYYAKQMGLPVGKLVCASNQNNVLTDFLSTGTYTAKREFFKISGHWDHYLDGMFVIGDPDDYTKECFALRPMTCPFQYQVFLNRARSYRDLPMRLGETSTLFRNEDSGEMHGLIRVRQFTISEGHIILRPDQLEEEFRHCLELAKYCLETVGLLEDCTFRFSQWDPDNTEKYIGTPEQWNEAQSIMGKILDHLGIKYTVGIDEAAFYGPKLDIQYKNVFGKEDTIVTIQIDQLLAEQFDMSYIDQNGQKVRPYIIHRTSLGCYERTLAYLIEKYAGALPTWLSPTQVALLPIADRHLDYVYEIKKALEERGVRVMVDDRNEKINKKIRDSQMEKIPYMLVIGDRDVENGTVSVRSRKDGDLGAMAPADFYANLTEEITTRAR